MIYIPKRLKIILVVLMTAIVGSCDDLRDNYDDCGVWLEFVFDHNMEYTDSFVEQVGSVDVLLFDDRGELAFSRTVDTDELEGRKRMFLGGDLPLGDYTVVTVGGLTEHFRFSQTDDGDFAHGRTTIEQVKLAVLRETDVMSSEIPHVWYGKPVPIRYRADLSVCLVPLIRQTNNFHITLQHTVTGTRGGVETRAEEEPLYVAEIVAPESGAYDYRNEPLVREKMTYRPHTQQASTVTSGGATTHRNVGRINTMRLLSNEKAGYRLVIRNTDTGAEAWSNDLLDLLPFDQNNVRDDGTPMQFQEYLDREVNWNIIIDHRGPATEGFVATSITVNGWIVWQTPIGI